MSDEIRPRRKGCWRAGCLGCTGVIAILVVVPLVLLVIGLASDPPAYDPQVSESARPLPPLASRPAVGAAGAPVDEGEGAAFLGDPERPPIVLAGETGQVVEVVLDLEMGSFIVEPGPPGEPIRVEADYDAGAFELSESFDEAARRYRLRFRHTAGFLALFGNGPGSGNRVRLILPRDYPLRLSGEIGLGDSRLDLGGLWLAEADLDFGAGDHRVDFSAPLPAPVERLAFEGSLGELALRSLGNASPRRLDVAHSAGAVRVDLSGAWQGDSEVRVRCGLGECVVRSPEEGVVFTIEGTRLMLGEKSIRPGAREVASDAPTVRLWARSTVGELRID